MLVFEERTLAFIKKHQLIERGDFVLVAVSGGPDSMALLDFLVRRRKQFDIQLAAVHVNHLLRGEQSFLDMEYVRTYCTRNGILLKATAIDIRKKMVLDQTGLQETARTYRYEYFAHIMKELGANKLAVAQHGDDQIETILMRLTRGSRGIGRAGIRSIRDFAVGQVIRPLLGVTKEQIEQYCYTYRLQPRLDPSNEQRDYTRNRFRLEVLPFLKGENEQVHEHFQRFSEDILEDEQYLEELTKREITTICHFRGNDISMEIDPFLRMPLSLQRRGIHLILSYLYKQKMDNVNVRHFQSIDQLLKGENPSGKLDLPLGLHVIRSYDSCLFTFDSPKQMSSFKHELHVGDELSLSNGMIIRFQRKSDRIIESDGQNSFPPT